MSFKTNQKKKIKHLHIPAYLRSVVYFFFFTFFKYRDGGARERDRAKDKTAVA